MDKYDDIQNVEESTLTPAQIEAYERRTRELQERFLAAYSESASITLSAQSANIARSCHYMWLKTHKWKDQYAIKFAQAHEQAIQSLEDVAIARAKDKSDPLLMFLLKGNKPDKYRERVEHSGEMSQVVNIVKFTDAAKQEERESETGDNSAEQVETETGSD